VLCRPITKRQLRAGAGRVPVERHEGDGAARHTRLGDLRARGVHPVRPEPAGRHGPGGAGGRARRAAGQRGVDPAAADGPGPARALLRHLQRGARAPARRPSSST
jgi:hypothetical protein